MATEQSPFEEENNLENDTSQELLSVLLLALIQAQNSIVISEFNNNTFNVIQSQLKSKSSEVLPFLNNTSHKAIQIGLDRTKRELGFDNLTIDYSDSRFTDLVTKVFNDNFEFILDTNREMYQELQNIANERGWSQEELARRLKKYYGLTPRYINTVLTLESALMSEGVSKKVLEQRIQKRIDQLLEWRMNLIAERISTAIIEGSKDESFGYLVDTSQIDRNEYVKQWSSLIDDVTTDICLSSNNTIAEIGGRFPNGLYHPPAYPPVHECRSSIALTKRNI